MNALRRDAHPNGPATPPPHAGPRWLSAVEGLGGSLIVVGHNIWRVLPNEVPILFLLGLLSFQLRQGSWRAMGLGSPRSWARTILSGIAAAIALQVISEFVTGPLLGPFLRHSAHAHPFNSVGGVPVALTWLAVVWTFAAFGEEIGYRGYLLNRLAEVGGGSRIGLVFGLASSSVVFGLGHWYQGPAGVAGTAVDGLVLGGAYLVSRRNLWVAIVAHGVSDTYALAVTFLGLAN